MFAAKKKAFKKNNNKENEMLDDLRCSEGGQSSHQLVNYTA